VVVNEYSSNGCHDCYGWGSAGTAAVAGLTGLAAGEALGAEASAGAAASANAYSAGVATGVAEATGAAPSGGTYTTLPANCLYQMVGGANYFRCGAMWLKPAFGANGVYYRAIPAPT
jgi:hypothetical protein